MTESGVATDVVSQRSAMTQALAVDLSGAGIAVGLVTDSGEIPCSQRIPIGEETASGVFAALCSAVDDVLHASGFDPDDTRGLAGIGVTLAGDHDRSSGSVSPDGLPAWRRYLLRDRLADRYAVPVRILADGIAMTVAEHWRGAARGRRNIAGIVASEKISGGLVLGGVLVAGTTGNAGQIGHVCVDPAGPRCACGAVGCLQAVAGTGAIAASYARQPGVGWRSLPWEPGGGDASARGGTSRRTAEPSWSPWPVGRIIEAAWSGEPVAVAVLRQAGEAIGTAMAGAVTLLDLDVVVVGGMLASAGAVLFDPIADGYRRHAGLDYAALPRVVPAVLGAEAPMLGAGAAMLRPHEYWPYSG